MVSDLKIFKSHLLLVLLQWIGIGNCITIVRDYRNDTLSCPKAVNCEKFNAVRYFGHSCICGGSFVIQDRKFLCVRESGTHADCNFYFNYYDKQIQGIDVQTTPLNEFLYNIVTPGNQCQQMNIDSVEMIGTNLNWENSEIDFKLTFAANQFFVRWKDGDSVIPSKYVGQLLKFNLKCGLADGRNINGCLLGKVKGSISWTEDEIGYGACDAAPGPTKTPTTPRSSSTETIVGVLSTKSPVSGSKKNNIGVIAGVVVGIIVLIAIIVILVCFVRKRNPSGMKKNENNNEQAKLEQQNNDEDIYEKIEPEQFENASYLTSLQTNQQSLVRKDDEIYDAPYENDPRNSIQQYSKLKRKEKEDNVPLECEYSALKIPKVESPYQRLSTSDDVNAYEDMSQDADYDQIY